MRKSLLFFSLLFFVPPMLASSKKESDLYKTKESVNDALNQFADGLHQALHGANKTGNDFLDQVDATVHRLWRKVTGPSSTKKQ